MRSKGKGGALAGSGISFADRNIDGSTSGSEASELAGETSRVSLSSALRFRSCALRDGRPPPPLPAAAEEAVEDDEPDDEDESEELRESREVCQNRKKRQNDRRFERSVRNGERQDVTSRGEGESQRLHYPVCNLDRAQRDIQGDPKGS